MGLHGSEKESRNRDTTHFYVYWYVERLGDMFENRQPVAWECSIF